MFQTKVVDKIKTQFILNNFFLENCAVYEITWKNVLDPGRPQMTIRRIRIACWITKATNMHSEEVILLFYCNGGCTNAPRCYVICTLPVLLIMQFYAFLQIDVSAPLSIMPVLGFFVPAAGLCIKERMSKCGCFTGSFVNNVAVKIEEAWQVDCEIKNASRPAWLIYSPVLFQSSVLLATATCTGCSLDIFHVWKKTVSKINLLFDAGASPSAFGRVVK
jgi:hypothetical protein